MRTDKDHESGQPEPLADDSRFAIPPALPPEDDHDEDRGLSPADFYGPFSQPQEKEA